MKLTTASARKLALVLAVISSAAFMTNCEHGGGPGNDIPLPTVTVSPASTSLPAGGSLQFTANVVSQSSTVITWYVNNILGGNSTVGTVSTAGLYEAPATIPNPATITVTAVSSAETNPYGAAIVSITAPVAATVTVSPTVVATPLGGTVQFVATVTGTTNTAVTWSVNGTAGGSSTVGTISSSGVYIAPTTTPNPSTVAITATSVAQTSDSASTTVTLTGSNTAPLYVNFGPNGQTSNFSTVNGLYTTIKVCLPSTIVCQTIPNVLVDTGSVGLRILDSVLTTVPANELETVTDSHGNQVEECHQFPNASYTWGSVLIADIGIGGQTASSVPIQVIGDATFNVPASGCFTATPGANIDSVQALGANAILGVGTGAQDCGNNCAGGQSFAGYPYYVCPNNSCQTVPVLAVKQVTNPVALLPKDNNGIIISLPAIPATGAPLLPYVNSEGSGLVPAGQLTLGIGTESNNAIGSATIYATDENSNFAKVVYNGTSYPSGGTLSSASNALYILNSSTLGIPECFDSVYYCPTSTTPVPITVYGTNGTSGSITLSIANADSLFGSSGYAAFNNLGGAGATGTSYFDLGLPFFFGRSVYVGIAGTAVPSKAAAPNGYFAF